MRIAAPTVDLFCSTPQYLDHAAPVWAALPAERRGTAWVAERLAGAATLLGVGPVRLGQPRPGPVLTLVAGYADCQTLGRPAAYLEHGAGQTYRGVDDPCYSGGPGHEHTALFLCPGPAVAARWRARYPAAPAVVVGCPKLAGLAARRAGRRTDLPPVAAVTFHSLTRICPETVGAVEHYRPGLAAVVDSLAAAGVAVVGHAHPKARRRLSQLWWSLGVPMVEDFAEIAERADVLAVDNSSVLYEAAALGLPVVALNAPWFRRDVSHGLRFWDLVPGPQVDGPDGLAEALLAQVRTPGAWAARAAAVAAEVYAPVADPARAAADAVVALLPTPA